MFDVVFEASFINIVLIVLTTGFALIGTLLTVGALVESVRDEKRSSGNINPLFSLAAAVLGISGFFYLFVPVYSDQVYPAMIASGILVLIRLVQYDM